MKTLNIKKAALVAALTVAPALGLTSTSAVQAAPAYRAPVPQKGYNAPNWNNNSRNDNNRFDARPNQARYQNNRNDNRFDPRRNDNNRFDPRRDNDRNRNNKKSSNDTAKIIGAGVVGAILGAVLSR